MARKFFSLMLVLAFLVCLSTIVQAATAIEYPPLCVTLIDDTDFGPESVIRDICRDREFLQLDFTTPYSYDEVVFKLGSGQEFEGWSVASELEVYLLAQSARIPPGTTAEPSIIFYTEVLMSWLCEDCIYDELAESGEPMGLKYVRGLTSETCSPIDFCPDGNKKAYHIGVEYSFYPTGNTISKVAGYAPQNLWGEYTWLFSCDDPSCADAETKLLDGGNTWLVRDFVGNHAPVIAPIGSLALREHQTVSITVEATDEDDGDTLTYSIDPLTPLPSGASFDTETRVFEFTPNGSQAAGSPYYVNFIVDDGTVEVSENVEITVLEDDSGLLQPIAMATRVRKPVRRIKTTDGGKTIEMAAAEMQKEEIDTDFDVAVKLKNEKLRNAKVTV